MTTPNVFYYRHTVAQVQELLSTTIHDWSIRQVDPSHKVLGCGWEINLHPPSLIDPWLVDSHTTPIE